LLRDERPTLHSESLFKADEAVMNSRRLISAITKTTLFAIMACAIPARAQVDTDPLNNIPVGADSLPLPVGGAIANMAQLAAPGDDVDFYSTFLLTGDVLLGLTTPIDDLPNTYDVPDTVASIFASGAQQTYNDDDGADELPNAGANRGSLFRFLSPGSGTYHIGVSGFGDEQLDGAASGDGHIEKGRYLLTAGRVNPAVLGGGFVDTDPANNNLPPLGPPNPPGPLGTPDLIALSPGVAKVAVAELLERDVDFFELHLSAGQVLSAMTAPLADLSNSFDLPDTRLALFNSTYTPPFPPYHTARLAENEDAGNFGEHSLDPGLASDNPGDGVFGSAIRVRITESGRYFLAVSGFGDVDYIGDHGEQGRYALLVGVALPEPGSITLAAIGLALLAWCRNRRP
jgi:hypothetical protein